MTKEYFRTTDIFPGRSTCYLALPPQVGSGTLYPYFLGGEGLFLATLIGHGTIYLQSLPFSQLADQIIQHAPSVGGSSKGEGSVLAGLGRMLDGD